MENLAVRQTMLDMMAYSEGSYRQQLHGALKQSLRTLARNGGGDLPLCVIAHGFGSVLAVDFFAELQAGLGHDDGRGDDDSDGPTALERGQTLAFLCTLGSPLPLTVGGRASTPLQVPASPVLVKWPHLRGGWTNFYHRGDCLGCPLVTVQPAVSHEFECRRRHKGDLPIQSTYFVDLVDCVGPIAQSMSHIWQDTNRKAGSGY